MTENITLREAKEILKANMDGWINSPLVKVDERLVKANDMAVKSLDAWDRIRNEITMLFHFDREAVIGIIDTHLKEFKSDPEDTCKRCKYHFDDKCTLGFVCINNSEFVSKKGDAI